MAPLGAAPAMMAASRASSAAHGRMPPTQGVAFKVQSKSAVALVNERRIEFVRAKNARTIGKIDEATGKLVTEGAKKPKKDVIVEPAEIERLLQWKHSRKIGPGFANLGNTCYLNSVLQCLSYTPSLVQYLLTKDALKTFAVTGGNTQQNGKHNNALMHKKPVGQGFCGVRVISRLLQSIHGNSASTGRVLQPKELVMNIRHISKNFRIGRQEDSHEFFRLLLDAMQRSCLRKAHIKQESHPAAATTFIHRVFGGKLKNSLKCAKCNYVSERFDDFLDLSLEINNGIQSVNGAIKHFTAVETLDDRNAWKCSSCNQPNRAEKGMTIDTCPNVLVIQLKRFDGMFGKIKKHIAFETTLDLSIGMQKTCADRQRGRNRYELHAVLVHAGFSTNCGHYYAFVKGSSGQWYEMNDDCVRWVSLDTVLQQKAYMLFYSRVLPKSEQPPPVVKTMEPESAPEPTPVAKATAEPHKKAEAVSKGPELSMNGFLTSLKTDLPTDEDGDVEMGERVAPAKRRVVTYQVTVPLKHKSLKRRLVPVFGGSVGKFSRFQIAKWKPAAPLSMTTTVDETEDMTPAVTAVPVAPKTPELPRPQVESVPINPRDLRNFGDKNAALYGKSVAQWGEDAASNGAAENGVAMLDSALEAQHERVLKQMKEADWKHRKAQRKSSWDEALDYGKTKKVKKRKDFVANEGTVNAFQLALLRKKQKK
ncbi:hypothetical protein Poli38472_001061 [Pythium oligandrum]|uniref:Ubiquitin carboxyl-terminal hydrolase n=1 Tax=Pythium oligandrum TaxID=41045 RepID=A0A8K1CSS0_PYTOL|nr:hypothetical protein Poli38472_001061 [Pythium oligandrum]|eukprot:TMW68905.1 hypothetical protein Poli38472_001061 [Pythium oligandrum]